ncbi:MAG: NADH:ubiquinone reductase (Na(+)-transporting) subunit B [Saprospiraceae bacterium]|nr:NADH:ubiquinone reductase (Na(+)-transporting) subunit B [Saprospiraceae bacterium]MBP6566443.1 NADH:ubiquinone reductase (Na(+)-transporting) subunit B [Saprospiraceae bacterium]
MGLIDFLKSIEPDKKKSPLLHTAYDAFFTFAYAPDTVTKGGTHIKDGMDLKRLMVTVVIAMQLCYLFGTYNIGHQHFVAAGEYLGFIEGFHLKLAHGLIKLLPIYIVSMAVGLGIEFYFAAKKGHAVEEGYLVTGALIPLIMPPDLPLWILTLSIVFAVIIGKEAFGGTGMNIWNIALLSRVFVFFAYPLTIASDQCWISGYEKISGGASADYGWFHTGFFNTLFEWMGLNTFNTATTVVDGFSGATPLALAYEGGWEKVTSVFSEGQMIWGAIPGSIGETNKVFIVIGALILILTRVASWRIMAGMLVGLIGTTWILNALGSTPFMTVTWTQHLMMGSFLFAMAFMATDPVTASSTDKGKWVYGILIGFIGIIIRVMNPAYPEGWMLAILLLNTFAPTIDYFVIESNIKKRFSRA